MNSMSEKMSKSNGDMAGARTDVPKQGDHFKCRECGMAIEVMTACQCKDPNHVHFQCCGQEMVKA